MDHPNQRLSSSTLLSTLKYKTNPAVNPRIFFATAFHKCKILYVASDFGCGSVIVKFFSRGSLLCSECISKFRMGNVVHKCFHWVDKRVDLATCLVGRKERMCSITLSGYSDNRSTASSSTIFLCNLSSKQTKHS